MEATTVYQFRDERGVLLYVGITKTGVARQLQHMAQAEWYAYYKTQTVEQYDTREDAKARESWLIRNERPIFNRQENPDWQQLRAAYLTLFDRSKAPQPVTSCDPWPRCADDDPSCSWDQEVVEDADETGDGIYCGRVDCVSCHAEFHGWERGHNWASCDVYDQFTGHIEGNLLFSHDQNCSICRIVFDYYCNASEDGERRVKERLTVNLADIAASDEPSWSAVAATARRLLTVARASVREIRAIDGFFCQSTADLLEATLLTTTPQPGIESVEREEVSA